MGGVASGWRRVARWAGCAVVVFLVLLSTIRLQVPKNFNDFDQSFYLTTAYDLVEHGVFSNGVFDDVDSTRATPPPGMFLGPGYPALVATVMAVSPRFASAVRCAVEANHKHRDLATCPIDNLPMHIVHALLLTIGVLAISHAARIAVPGVDLFFGVAALATVGVAGEAWLFSYLMTESLQFGLYGVFAWMLAITLTQGRWRNAAVTGLVVGVLVLTKPSWLVMVPVVMVLMLASRWLMPAPQRPISLSLMSFALAVAVVVGPWVARNAVVLGKPGLTEEYGAVSLIERFAFNDMSVREALFAVPHCVPVVGPMLTGPMRFDWDEKGSFFETGRGRRDALVAQHKRIDPIVGDLFRQEMADGGWWRHLLVSLPLAWCGLFVGQMWSIAMLPLFAISLARAVARRQWVFVAYAIPAFAMVAVHALLANHYPRYNLALIGPMAIGAAWIIAKVVRRLRPVS